MITNYYKTKLVKMGKWALLPADLDNWFTEDTSRYFKKVFGFGKGILIIMTLYDGGFEHPYTPLWYIKKVHNFIKTSTAKNYKSLEKRLLKFYGLREKLKKEIPKLNTDQIAKLSDQELIKIYKANRDFAHQATVFDQFTWMAEDYWNPVIEKILTKKLKLKVDSEKYHYILFTLVTPEKISTTLEEKRSVLEKIICLQKNQTTIKLAAEQLAKNFGWMSVSAYGKPWDAKHYESELVELKTQPMSKIEQEYKELKDYEEIRNKKINEIIRKCRLSLKDLQVFIDFGLALDTRNEAEYLVSFCGFYLLPLYQEIAKRLAISIGELRKLYEDEIIQALQGKLDYQERLLECQRMRGYGYNQAMTKRHYFTPQEAEKLFQHVEKTVTYIQGVNEYKGVCASPGKIKGKAKIVISPATDNYKVKKGDIMIAVATMVDHLPAMKNAAAVITEVGGLTCHAAVVSREFGIPCIVALKNATKNFKDGDLVEVDAEKGIVRKIN